MIAFMGALMKSLKTLAVGLASAATIAAAVGSANAADLDPGPEDRVQGEYPMLWSGFYIGVNIGAAFDESDVEVFDDETILIGGGHLGYNFQTPNNLVLGIEGDITDLDNVDTLVSIRGRLGYAIGPTLLYGTGGVAFFGEGDVFDEDSDTGYVVGGGLERKLTRNVSLGVEGLYYSFEDEVTDDEINFWAVRARATFHFNDFY
jgi:outer membrane immunogenic protein